MGGCDLTLSAKSLLGVCGAVLIAVGFAEVAGSLALKAKYPPTKMDIPLAPGDYIPLLESGYRVPSLMHGECVNLLLNAGARDPSSFAPGEYVNEPLNADYLALKDFRIETYPSGKISQYVSDVQIFSPFTNKMHNASISVNHPLIWNGWWIYQTSFDPNAEGVTILTAMRDQWLPLAAAGGIMLLLGTFLFGLTSFFPDGPRRAFRSCSDSECATRLNNKKLLLWPRVLCGVLVVSIPIFIIGRSMLRADPMPALRSPLMTPHVVSYAVSYVMLLFAAFGVWKRMMPFGWFLMTLGLVLGALWGKICWSDFWQYDPKENWSFVTWSIYALYFMLRRFRVPEMLLRYVGAVSVVFTCCLSRLPIFAKLFTGLHSYG